jgi:HEAT repeat protein
MAFYDRSKAERQKIVALIGHEISEELKSGENKRTLEYFSDSDTYIRKAGYLAIGKIFMARGEAADGILDFLLQLLQNKNEKVRQTVINAAGEIGKKNFEAVRHFFENGLFDHHHSVRNAVIGSIKKMGEVNPVPVLNWAKKYLYHPDKEIRREICHGIELRGRKHPGNILPLLKEMQFDKTSRVRSTLVHVLGQISYKKGCLELVLDDLARWQNKELVKDAIAEILDVHDRYRDFAVLSRKQAEKIVAARFKG